MFAADSGELQQHVETDRGLLCCRREGCKDVPIFGISTLGITHRAANMQALNILVAIGLRQGNPEMGGTGGEPRCRDTRQRCEIQLALPEPFSLLCSAFP